MQVTSLLDIGQDLLQVSVGLVTVVEQQDTTALSTGLAVVRIPVGQLVLEPVVSWVRNTKVLDQHGRHVFLDHWQVQFTSHFVDDRRLATTRSPLDSDGTTDT